MELAFPKTSFCLPMRVFRSPERRLPVPMRLLLLPERALARRGGGVGVRSRERTSGKGAWVEGEGKGGDGWLGRILSVCMGSRIRRVIMRDDKPISILPLLFY